jgi:hypothetical protein
LAATPAAAGALAGILGTLHQRLERLHSGLIGRLLTYGRPQVVADPTQQDSRELIALDRQPRMVHGPEVQENRDADRRHDDDGQAERQHDLQQRKPSSWYSMAHSDPPDDVPVELADEELLVVVAAIASGVFTQRTSEHDTGFLSFGAYRSTVTRTATNSGELVCETSRL